MVQHAIDPRDGRTFARHAETTPQAASAAVDAAWATQRRWRDVPLAERCARAAALGEVLLARRDADAELMAREMGKPVAQGRAEIEKCARLCAWAADAAPAALADEPVATEARTSVSYRPLGVVLGVMPWNFPYWQVVRFALPALLAGNTTLLKHASNVPGCALALHEAFAAAGFPAGAFTTLLLPSRDVHALLGHPRVAAASLTGSTPAGRAVAARCGELLKPCVLELGGSDPYVVLADADLGLAAREGAAARLVNAGQSCIAAKRFVVVREVLHAFEELLVARMAEAVAGDPLDPSTTLGPLARADLRDELARQVGRSVSLGARPRLGCETPPGPGAWYPASVLAGVRPGMPAFDEELFGPVAAVVPADDEEHALELAAATPFGLGAAVFTRDAARGERIARERLEAGSCFVNAFVRSDPRLPFGGVKESGFGRELGTPGLRAFTNAKTVWVAP